MKNINPNSLTDIVTNLICFVMFQSVVFALVIHSIWVLSDGLIYSYSAKHSGILFHI